MITRNFEITLRIPEQGYIPMCFDVVQNDKDVYSLTVHITDGLDEIDYTQISSATITFAKADGKVVQGDMTVGTDSLTYTMGTNEISYPGQVLASIQLFGSSGERLTTARFSFEVISDLITPQTVKSTSEFPILQRLVKDVEDTLPLLPEIEETIEKFPQIQGFFNTAQAAENQRISNEITRQSQEDVRQSQESVRQAKIIEIEERFQRLTSQQQHDAEVIDARDGETSLRARLDRDHAEFESHKADYDTFKQDIKGYIGYTENDIVGVEADFVNNKFTRLAGAINKTPGADFDSIKAFGGRKRCILTDDGVVLAYYGEPGYIEDGSNGQVMVEQPKFYYKVVPLQLEPIADGIGYHLRKARYYVSDVPKPGFKIHPAFVRNGVVKDKIYLSAYEGCIYDVSAETYLLNDEQVADFDNDKLSSIAGAKPASGLTQNLTRANIRKLANNRGAGWQLSDVLSASVTQMLFIIEYASFNTQANIGLGVVNKADGEGNESEITGATTNLGNASGMADGTNGLVSISYRGEENFWGNIWKWMDGLNIEAKGIHQAYWADSGFADDIKTSPYKNCGFTLAKANGYVSAFGYSEDCDFLFLPSETVGNSSLPVGDSFFQNHTYDGFMASSLGGRWHYSSTAGGFCWIVYYWSSYHARYIGGRLLYVPSVAAYSG